MKKKVKYHQIFVRYLTKSKKKKSFLKVKQKQMSSFLSSAPHIFPRSRNPSPVYISSPLTSRDNPRLAPLFQSKSPTVVRASSVSPFKRITGVNVEKSQNNDQNNEASLFWKNKYESLNMIYQMEIDELRKFYAVQNQQIQTITPVQPIQTNIEEINQIKKDNRVLSEFIKKNQEEIESLANENQELKRKLSEISLTVEKVDDLIDKNQKINMLTDRKTEELAELMLKNTELQEILNCKNDEMDHLKNLVTQLIQDNDRLSEVLEPLKREILDVSNALDNAKQQLDERSGQREILEREIQELKEINEELNAQLSMKFKEEDQQKGMEFQFNQNMTRVNENHEFAVLVENFNVMKEENYKLKQEIQGYYGDILLMREREKMMRSELEKNKRGYDSGKNKSKDNSGLLIK